MSNTYKMQPEDLSYHGLLTKEQKQIVQKIIDEAYEIKNSSLSEEQKLGLFKNKVRTNGEWDIKSLKDKEGKALIPEEQLYPNEELGNVMYGVSGSIIGIKPEILVAAAGGQQLAQDIKSNKWAFVLGTLGDLAWGEWQNIDKFDMNEYDFTPYGALDNNDDPKKIIRGIEDAKKVGIVGEDIGYIAGVKFGLKKIVEVLNKSDKSAKGNETHNEESLKLQKLADFFENLSEEELESKADEIKELLEQIDKLSADELKEKLNLLGENQESQDGEKINFDGLKNDENIENKDDEQMGKIPEQIEQNKEEQNKEEQNNNTTNGSAANIVELAKQNVSLYNQNINKGYDDIMGFLFG